MHDRRITLDQITVAIPCPADWSPMSGGGATKFCEHCQKHVHNLSEMTRDEAQSLLCGSAGKLCVRYQPDASGNVMTLDYARKIEVPRWRKWAVFGSIGGAIATALMVLGCRKDTAAPVTPMVMGDIAIKAPAPMTGETQAP